MEKIDKFLVAKPNYFNPYEQPDAQDSGNYLKYIAIYNNAFNIAI